MNHSSRQDQLVLKTDSGQVSSALLSISLATGNFLYLENYVFHAGLQTKLSPVTLQSIILNSPLSLQYESRLNGVLKSVPSDTKFPFHILNHVLPLQAC